MTLQSNDMTESEAANAPAGPKAYAEAWGVDKAFGPGTPVLPYVKDDELPRVFDYAAGINLYMTPRGGYNQLPFAALRNFADYCDVVRIVIEALKREIRSLEWGIQKVDEEDKTDYTNQISELEKFWRKPDGVTEFDGWCNAILEDLFVYDAVTLWLNREGTGKITAIEQIDGSTIRPLLNVRGRVPAPPVPGYMQVLKGRNWQWFTADNLLYRPYNLSINSPYGKSPTEYLILRINETLRRQMAATSYWDQTNVPEAMVFLPAEWSTEQVKQFQEYFDALLSGNIGALRRLKFLPSPGASPVYEFRRPDATSNIAFDEWMLKMTCWAFGFLPSEFGLTGGEGLGGKGFMDGQENSLYRFGVGPIIQYLQNLFTGVLQQQTDLPLCWKFKNVGPEEDQLMETQILEKQLLNGAIDINVWRERIGQKPLPDAKPFIIVGGSPVLLEDVFNPPPPPPQLAGFTGQDPQPQDEEAAPAAGDGPGDKEAPPEDDVPEEFGKMALMHWREKCLRRMKDKKAPDCEPPAVSLGMIQPLVRVGIRSGLQKCKTRDEVNAVFEAASPKVSAPLFSEAVGLEKVKLTDLSPEERKVYDALMKVLDKAGPEIAKKIRRGEPVHLMDLSQELRRELEPVLLDIYRMGIARGEDALTIPLEDALEMTHAARWAASYTPVLVTGITQRTSMLIQQVVTRYMNSSGMTIGDVVAALDPAFGKTRATAIAVTEATRASSAGMQAYQNEMKKAGIKTKRVSHTNEDDKVCPICRPLDGKAEDEWPQQDGPPWHVRCRCFLTLEVVKDDEE